MAKKNNDSILLFGLAVGVGVTVFALKQFTTVFDEVEKILKKKPIKLRVQEFMTQANKIYTKLSSDVTDFAADKTEKLNEFMKKSPTVKKLKKAVKKAVTSPEFIKAKEATEKTATDLFEEVKSFTKKVQATKKAKVAKGLVVKEKNVKKNPTKKTIKVIAKSEKADGKSIALLAKMEKSKQYTQRELADATKIPYRSVRRYVENLTKLGKIVETGYGKGKRFMKK